MRAQRSGPNKLAAGKAEPRWHAFARQYNDPMQIVLLAAGIGSIYPLKQLGTGVLLILLTLFNAVMNLRQEGQAAASVAALQKMTIIKARVRRDGQLAEIPAGQLVPGDIVAIEAGDVVPADGRLLTAATLEADESALTGESLPVAKGTEPVAGAGTPLGDRADMVYMNTNVTRGAGEFADVLGLAHWVLVHLPWEMPNAAPIAKWLTAFSGERCALRSSTGRRSAS